MLDGMGGQRHAPAILSPGKRPGTHCKGGWLGPRANLDGCGKSRPASGFDPPTFQHVANRCTDWAIATPKFRGSRFLNVGSFYQPTRRLIPDAVLILIILQHSTSSSCGTFPTITASAQISVSSLKQPHCIMPTATVHLHHTNTYNYSCWV